MNREQRQIEREQRLARRHEARMKEISRVEQQKVVEQSTVKFRASSRAVSQNAGGCGCTRSKG